MIERDEAAGATANRYHYTRTVEIAGRTRQFVDEVDRGGGKGWSRSAVWVPVTARRGAVR